MKKLFLIILVGLLIIFMCCETENIEDLQPPKKSVSDLEVSIINEWRLIDGKMYFTNIMTDEKFYVNHFNENKNLSSLNFPAPIYNIEKIEKDCTIWEFTEPNNIPGYGGFILNRDSSNRYAFYVTRYSWRIIEHPQSTSPSDLQLGGSARPFNSYIVGEDTIIIQIQEQYTNINGYNYKYFSELKFVKI